MNKYIIRALKQFIYFAIIVLIMTLLVYYLTDHDSSLKYTDLFKESSGTKIFLLLLLFSLIYPIFGYTKKEVGLKGTLTENYNALCSALRECNFELSDKDSSRDSTGKSMVFRHKSGFVRCMRMFEDAVTITDLENGFVQVEGLRKEIVRVVGAIERNLYKEEN